MVGGYTRGVVGGYTRGVVGGGHTWGGRGGGHMWGGRGVHTWEFLGWYEPNISSSYIYHMSSICSIHSVHALPR